MTLNATTIAHTERAASRKSVIVFRTWLFDLNTHLQIDQSSVEK